MTGAEARIKTLARAYQVYYARTGGAESNDTYLMEHTAWIFLVGRDGKILQRFPHTATPEQIIARIQAEFTKPMS